MSKDNQEKNLIKRGRYALYNPETGKPATFQRVTNFAKLLDDQSGLIDWTARHVAKGMSHEEADLLLLEAGNTDVNDRGAMDRVWQAAKKLAGGSRAAEDGTTIHGLTEAVDRGEEPEVPVKWRGHLQRYQRLMEEGPLQVLPEYIERVVVNTLLGTAGTFDRLCRVKRDTTVTFPSGKTVELREGENVIVDVKTSKALQFSQVSFSIQFACYAHSKYLFNTETEVYEELPEINKEAAFVVWIPSTKSDAELVAVDLERGWDNAQECLRVRERRNFKKLLSTVTSLKEEDPETFASRIRNARSREELSAIWNEANSLGMWNKELEAAGKNRLREIA